VVGLERHGRYSAHVFLVTIRRLLSAALAWCLRGVRVCLRGFFDGKLKILFHLSGLLKTRLQDMTWNGIFQGIFTTLDEFYFTTAEKKILENCRCILPNFKNDYEIRNNAPAIFSFLKLNEKLLNAPAL
jgi:hypothetical protein